MVINSLNSGYFPRSVFLILWIVNPSSNIEEIVACKLSIASSDAASNTLKYLTLNLSCTKRAWSNFFTPFNDSRYSCLNPGRSFNFRKYLRLCALFNLASKLFVSLLMIPTALRAILRIAVILSTGFFHE